MQHIIKLAIIFHHIWFFSSFINACFWHAKQHTSGYDWILNISLFNIENQNYLQVKRLCVNILISWTNLTEWNILLYYEQTKKILMWHIEKVTSKTSYFIPHYIHLSRFHSSHFIFVHTQVDVRIHIKRLRVLHTKMFVKEGLRIFVIEGFEFLQIRLSYSDNFSSSTQCLFWHMIHQLQ